jgi:hypothetical protein
MLQAGEISDGLGVTKRPNSIKVGREKGCVVYVAESETEMVEWMSALETTITQLMKIIAGVDDEPPAAATGRNTSTNNASFLKKMESNMQSSARGASHVEGREQSGHNGGGGGGRQTVYPGLQAPSIPSPASSYSSYLVGGSGGSGGGSVFRDEYGNSYGTGSGMTIEGVVSAVYCILVSSRQRHKQAKA